MAFAQKPDFSGTWAPDAAAAPAGGAVVAAAAAWRGPMTVVMKGDTLTVERTAGENKIVTIYKLDGTASENKMMGRGGEVVTKSTAKWDGDKLVISTERPGQDGAPMTQVQTWSMEGGNLVIERPGRDGATMKTVYKKTT